jgi:hypothetical protein
VRSSPRVSASRQRAAGIAKGLRQAVQPLLHPQTLLRGTVYELRTRCGKSSCACARSNEKRHRRWVLSYTVEGQKRMRVVPLNRLAEWRRWADNAREFRLQRARVSEMTRQLLEDIDVIERGLRRDPDKGAP